MNKKLQTVRNHLFRGIEDAGCYTSDDFKKFAREFKSMINEELKAVGGTDYQQSKGTHYYVSGFFKVGEQAYYISIPDVRYENPNRINLLIRTAKDYRDFTGGTNHYIDFMEHENIFVNSLPRA